MLIHRSTRHRGPRRTSRTLRTAAAAPATAGIRHELVARVRAEIAAGMYDTPERFDAALAIMSTRLGLD